METGTGFKIVVVVNKKDVWFCRICVASIRYYYPDVEIYLLRDELNGEFSTNEIEQKWNVGRIEYDIKNFGWSAAKMFFYTDERFKGGHFLVLDSDIVFIGRLLEKLQSLIIDADVIVSPELESNPYAEWVPKTYFDVKKAEKQNPDYTHPGYFFNAGQLALKGGKFSRADFADFFDFEQFPYWRELALFPLVDQSMLNYLLPQFEKSGKIKVNATYKYMVWSEADELKGMKLALMKEGTHFPQLIHWAGALRIPYLKKMTRSDILLFFEDYYYKQIPLGGLKRIIRKVWPISIYYLRTIYHAVKRKVKK